jgi:hypothetical protein
VHVRAGDNVADRHRTAPAGEGPAAAASHKLLVRVEQPRILLQTVRTRHSTTNGYPSTCDAVAEHPQPPPTLFAICSVSELTSGLFWLHGSAEPTIGSFRIRGFPVKSSQLARYEGKCTLDDVIACLFAFEGHSKNVAHAIGWVGMTGWGKQAVLQLKR